jgi:hypothetical protein
MIDHAIREELGSRSSSEAREAGAGARKTAGADDRSTHKSESPPQLLARRNTTG